MPQYIYIVSLNGQLITPSFHADDATGATDILYAGVQCSTVAWDKYQEVTFHTFTPPDPHSGPQDLRASATLNFTSVRGTPVRVIIPSFAPSLYAGDNETVDSDSTEVANFIANFVEHGRTAGGVAIAAYRTGQKSRTPLPPLTRF